MSGQQSCEGNLDDHLRDTNVHLRSLNEHNRSSSDDDIGSLVVDHSTPSRLISERNRIKHERSGSNDGA
jgi:hypothetical protein